MIQFLNNIWIALSSENVELVNTLVLFAGVIENYLFILLFLNAFNVNSSFSQRGLYVVLIFSISLFTMNFITSPFNIIINYCCMLALIYFVFKLTWVKSFVSLILSLFVFALLNILIQNSYLTILNISFDTFMNVPIYRLLYLTILYISLFVTGKLFKNFQNMKLNLSFLDNLDKKTLILLCTNACVGFLALCIQLITTTFYIDIVPLIISILNFVLLASYLVLSIYSLTRVIKLSNTKKELASAEEYNKSLQNLYDEVKGFKHDFDNIVSTLDGYIETNDMHGLKEYFYGIKRDCKLAIFCRKNTN